MSNEKQNSDVQGTLLVAGGLALMVFGVGCIAANSRAMSTLLTKFAPKLGGTKDSLTEGFAGILPDVERYVRLKTM